MPLKPGHGSTLTRDAAPPVALCPPLPPHRATILVVEDEDPLRQLLVRLLTGFGFNVLAAANGRIALEVWARHRARIDLLLTDMVMPDGVSGTQLAQQCLEEKGALKVIFTSGYSMELSQRDAELRPEIGFLQKPYRPEQLERLIRAALPAS